MKIPFGPDMIFHTEEVPWTCGVAKGISYKSLRYDGETHAGAVLIHMCPETTYPSHLAHGGMDILVLDGDLTVAEAPLQRYSYAHLPVGATSSPVTRDGCILYVTFPGKIENLRN